MFRRSVMFLVLLVSAVGAYSQVQLIELAQLGLKGATGIQVNGAYTFCATSNSLDVYDLADPSRPVVLGRRALDGLGEPNLRLEGGFAYVCDKLSGDNHQGDFYILNIENPRRPILYSQVVVSPCQDFIVSDSTAFLACGYAGLEFYDISNKLSPHYLHSTEADGGAYGIFLEGSTLYVAEYKKMEIFNVEDPASPVLLGSVSYNGLGETVWVRNGYAYVAGSTHGIHVINVETPDSPTLEMTLDAYGANAGYNIEGNGDYAYFTYATSYSTHSVGILDVSNPSTPQILDVDLGDFPLTDALCANPPYLYVTGWRGGLSVFNISNPELPVPVPLGDLFNLEGRIASTEGALYVEDGEKIRTVDTSDPFRLSYVDHTELSQEVTDIDAQDDLMALAAKGEARFLLYDISNPTSPQFKCLSPDLQIDIDNSSYRVCLDNNHAYLSMNDLFVFDLSDPDAPLNLGQVSVNATTTADLVADGDYVYVAASVGGLRIIDVSVPETPSRIGELNIESTCTAIAKSGNLVFLLNWDYSAPETTGLHIIDVSDPASPVLLSSLNTPGSSTGVQVEGHIVYIGDGYSGIQVVDASDPADPVLLQAFAPTKSAFSHLLLSGNGTLFACDTSWDAVWTIDLRCRTNVPCAPLELSDAGETAMVSPWLINPNPVDAGVDVIWRDDSGQTLDIEHFTIPSLGKMKINNEESKTKAKQAHSVEVATHGPVLSYHEIAGQSCRMIAAYGDSRNEMLLLPHIAEETAYWNTLTLLSNRNGGSVLFEMGTGVMHDLDGAFSLTYNVEALLETTDEETAWGQYTSSPESAQVTGQTLSGYELFVKEGNDGAAVELPDRASLTIYIPHIPTETDYFWTGFTMVNPNDETANVLVQFFTEDGVELESKRIYIQPQTKIKGLMEGLFPEVHGTACWGLISSDRPIVALELYGTFNAGICGYGLPYDLSTDLVLPVVEMEPGNWTGIALTNPNDEVATVTLELRSDQGTVKSAWTGEIAAHARIKDVIQNYFTESTFEETDYIAIVSSVGITATEVAGADDWSYMEAIAGMF